MQAALYRSFGEPDEVLELADVPKPTPGPGQVLLRTLLSSIHHHDLATIRGIYGYRPELPAIGGTEAVGVVDAVGEGVAPSLLGSRMSVASARGTWAQFFVAPEHSLVPVPEGIPDTAAAQLLAMPFSALLLLDSLQANPGDWIVQNSANGAVGRALARLAAARGVQVISLVRRDAGVAELTQAGIGHALSTAQPGWQESLKALTGGAPLRAAVDSIGGDASGELLAQLGEGGRLVSFGALSGQAIRLNPRDLIFRRATVQGFWASKAGPALPADTRHALMRELIGRVASGELPLPVEAVHGLDSLADAMQAAQQPGRQGKVLFRP